MNRPIELALGTVQLGLPYGVANHGGQPSEEVAQAIVERAFARGIRYFDTAQSYGESEAVLGRAFAALGIADRVRAITKLAAGVVAGANEPEDIVSSLRASAARLGVRSFWAVLLHAEDQLDLMDGPLGEGIRKARAEGLVERFGVSVYAQARALEALEREDVDAIQVPANLFDHRMVDAGVFGRARQQGKTVFVRSVFLQGLALMEPDDAPREIAGARDAVRRLSEFCSTKGVGRRDFAIGYMGRRAEGHPLLVGCETVEQLADNCDSAENRRVSDSVLDEWDGLLAGSELGNVIDPRTWPKRAGA